MLFIPTPFSEIAIKKSENDDQVEILEELGNRINKLLQKILWKSDDLILIFQKLKNFELDLIRGRVADDGEAELKYKVDKAMLTVKTNGLVWKFAINFKKFINNLNEIPVIVLEHSVSTYGLPSYRAPWHPYMFHVFSL